MNERDWSADEDRLFEETVRAIERFARDRGDERCSFLAFDSDPERGHVMLAFDTVENALRAARVRYERELEAQRQASARDRGWQTAVYHARRARPALHAPNTGDFAYPDFATVRFPDWEQWAALDDDPAREPWQDDYLEGNVVLLFGRSIDRVLAAGVLDCLSRAAPFRIGFNFHDGDLCVLRITDWPEP